MLIMPIAGSFSMLTAAPLFKVYIPVYQKHWLTNDTQQKKDDYRSNRLM